MVSTFKANCAALKQGIFKRFPAYESSIILLYSVHSVRYSDEYQYLTLCTPDASISPSDMTAPGAKQLPVDVQANFTSSSALW